MPIASINPATGQTLRQFAALSASEIDEKLQLAAAAFQRQRRSTFAQRGERMRRAADILQAERGQLARLATLEMGKPLAAAEGEVDKCALGLPTLCRSGRADAGR